MATAESRNYTLNYCPPKVQKLDTEKLKNVAGAAEFLAAFPKPGESRYPEASGRGKGSRKSKCCRFPNVLKLFRGCGCACVRGKKSTKSPSGLRVYEKNV